MVSERRSHQPKPTRKASVPEAVASPVVSRSKHSSGLSMWHAVGEGGQAPADRLRCWLVASNSATPRDADGRPAQRARLRRVINARPRLNDGARRRGDAADRDAGRGRHVSISCRSLSGLVCQLACHAALRLRIGRLAREHPQQPARDMRLAPPLTSMRGPTQAGQPSSHEHASTRLSAPAISSACGRRAARRDRRRPGPSRTGRRWVARRAASGPGRPCRCRAGSAMSRTLATVCIARPGAGERHVQVVTSP